MANRSFIGIATSAPAAALSRAPGDGFGSALRENERERRAAFRSGLLYLQQEAREVGAHLAASLIGAAGEALSPSGTERPHVDIEAFGDRSDEMGDNRAGLARCLSLLREELSELADPMPARFVHAAIMSLGDSGPWEIARELHSRVSVRKSQQD